MINLELTDDEIQSLIQALRTEREAYEKEFGSSTLEIVQQVTRRVIDRDAMLIEKLQTYVGEGVPF